jgi:hypothetical protein
MFTGRPTRQATQAEGPRRAGPTPRRRGRALAMLAATVGTAAAIGVAGSAVPAFADDGGNTFCFLSTGSISAQATGTTSPHPVEIQWSVSAPYCTAYTTYISGPGFTSSQA